MFSSSVARLTKQLTHLSVGRGAIANNTIVGTATPSTISARGFAVNRKVIDAKNVKRLKIQAKKKKNVNRPVRETHAQNALSSST